MDVEVDTERLLWMSICRLQQDSSVEGQWLLRGLEEFRRQNGRVPLCTILGFRGRGRRTRETQQRLYCRNLALRSAANFLRHQNETPESLTPAGVAYRLSEAIIQFVSRVLPRAKRVGEAACKNNPLHLLLWRAAQYAPLPTSARRIGDILKAMQ
jgi:hypothetical protein